MAGRGELVGRRRVAAVLVSLLFLVLLSSCSLDANATSKGKSVPGRSVSTSPATTHSAKLALGPPPNPMGSFPLLPLAQQVTRKLRANGGENRLAAVLPLCDLG